MVKDFIIGSYACVKYILWYWHTFRAFVGALFFDTAWVTRDVHLVYNIHPSISRPQWNTNNVVLEVDLYNQLEASHIV